MPPPIRPRPRNAMRGVLMAGEFPDVNAERYNKRAKNSGGKFGGVGMGKRLRLGVSWADPPTRCACPGPVVKPRGSQPSPGLPMTVHCGHAC